MSFYSQVKGNDSSYIIILRIMTDYLMFSLDYGGDTNYQAGIFFCYFAPLHFGDQNNINHPSYGSKIIISMYCYHPRYSYLQVYRNIRRTKPVTILLPKIDVIYLRFIHSTCYAPLNHKKGPSSFNSQVISLKNIT